MGEVQKFGLLCIPEIMSIFYPAYMVVQSASVFYFILCDLDCFAGASISMSRILETNTFLFLFLIRFGGKVVIKDVVRPNQRFVMLYQD